MSTEKSGVNAGAMPELKLELLDSHDVARRLGITPDRTRQLLRKGILPGAQIGKKWVVSKQQLDAYIARLFSAVNRIQT